jgi:hypothetical protein
MKKTPNAERPTPNIEWGGGVGEMPNETYPGPSAGKVDDFLYGGLLTLTLTY